MSELEVVEFDSASNIEFLLVLIGIIFSGITKMRICWMGQLFM